MKASKQQIIDIINKSGIPDASICSFLPLFPYLIECGAKQRLPKNVKTAIMCVFPYKVKEKKPKNISRYAAVPDYHNVLSKYLSNAVNQLKIAFPQSEFVYFTDNSPVPEVYAAVSAGLGVLGDNGLLITEKYGSFVFIGEIVTDLESDYSDFSLKECMHCGNCKKNCPKSENIGCLSAITQKKGELTEKETEIMKSLGTVWGCDICSDVCPMNKDKALTYIPEFINGYKEEYVLGEDISGRAYEWRGEKVIKRNFCL